MYSMSDVHAPFPVKRRSLGKAEKSCPRYSDHILLVSAPLVRGRLWLKPSRRQRVTPTRELSFSSASFHQYQWPRWVRPFGSSLNSMRKICQLSMVVPRRQVSRTRWRPGLPFGLVAYSRMVQAAVVVSLRYPHVSTFAQSWSALSPLPSSLEVLETQISFWVSYW